jgi:hypothetical protein
MLNNGEVPRFYKNILWFLVIMSFTALLRKKTHWREELFSMIVLTQIWEFSFFISDFKARGLLFPLLRLCLTLDQDHKYLGHFFCRGKGFVVACSQNKNSIVNVCRFAGWNIEVRYMDFVYSRKI